MMEKLDSDLKTLNNQQKEKDKQVRTVYGFVMTSYEWRHMSDVTMEINLAHELPEILWD